jgi:hypothetical protein
MVTWDKAVRRMVWGSGGGIEIRPLSCPPGVSRLALWHLLEMRSDYGMCYVWVSPPGRSLVLYPFRSQWRLSRLYLH